MRDIHNEIDERNLEVRKIGICDIKLPFSFENSFVIDTVSEIEAGVILDKKQRGAHLSRITEVLNEKIKENTIHSCG